MHLNVFCVAAMSRNPATSEPVPVFFWVTKPTLVHIGDPCTFQCLRKRTLRKASTTTDCVLSNIYKHQYAVLLKQLDKLADVAAFVPNGEYLPSGPTLRPRAHTLESKCN
jgi:hypothetical protein